MRFISTRAHGIMDYVVSAILIISPWLLGFAAGGAETAIPIILGIVIFLMSLFTDYEPGALRKIPFRVHLTLDILAGIFLAVSPWLLGYSNVVWLPHLIVGAYIVFAGFFTSAMPAHCPEGTPCYENKYRVAH